MGKKKLRNKHGFPPNSQFENYYNIDEFTEQGIKQSKARIEGILKFHWEFHCDLALQRTNVLSDIKKALSEASISKFEFPNWKRLVHFRHSNAPLSSRGSLLSDTGGRFNIGDIDSTRFPPFPALYIGYDMETCTHEAFGIPQNSKLSVYDQALVKKSSLSYVTLNGQIDSVIDLMASTEKLKQFVDIIKKFTVSHNLKQTAKALQLPEPTLITTARQLTDSILSNNWRNSPMQLDIPAPPQIFGQLVMESGIGGIVYPSQFTKHPCLAVFPQNFSNTDSYVQLEETNLPDTVVRRLDASNWDRLC